MGQSNLKLLNLVKVIIQIMNTCIYSKLDKVYCANNLDIILKPYYEINIITQLRFSRIKITLSIVYISYKQVIIV